MLLYRGPLLFLFSTVLIINSSRPTYAFQSPQSSSRLSFRTVANDVQAKGPIFGCLLGGIKKRGNRITLWSSSPSSSSSTRETNNDNLDYNQSNYFQSYVEKITCQNFMPNVVGSRTKNEEDEDDNSGSNEVTIYLGNEGPNLVAVTGETGSGKSLLVFKLFQLVLGEKVSSSIMRASSSVSGEVVLKLSNPHLGFIHEKMELLGISTSEIIPVTSDGFGELRLKRTILKSTHGRVRSKCEINGKQVTLKTLRSISKPLITIVDASVASAALSQSKARTAIIDTGVSNQLLSKVRETRKIYRNARKRREEIDREIENRVMPKSFVATDSDENIELLQHWIEELDGFQTRISNFQDSIISSRGAATLLASGESDYMMMTDDDGGDKIDTDTDDIISDDSSFVHILRKFSHSSWERDEKAGAEPPSISDLFYSNLLDLRDGVRSLDLKLSSAKTSCEALSSLSSSQSVAFALEESRKHLFEATAGYEDNEDLIDAAEKSHELLNKLEDALSSCVNFMSDHPSGLLSTLEKMRQSVYISIEDFDFLIADWGSLARKHGVSPFSLPSLHYSLRQELDGNVEARLMLPKAKDEEKHALAEFDKACRSLSQARAKVCSNLTMSVTSRLKDLGMEGSTFTSQLEENVHECTDSAAYSDGNMLGTDSVSFLLTHRNVNENPRAKNSSGNLDVIGSSGEKARLLLAIETDLPGSVGASCNTVNSNAGETTEYSDPGPVIVVYDEIDAHVGGRAAVSLAKLLSDQAQCKNSNHSNKAKRNQVVSITHSPSIAAIADRHIVVQKILALNGNQNGRDLVIVDSVKGMSRLEEISRMTSGDLALKESINFAGALLRDGSKYKQQQKHQNNNDSEE